MDPSARKRAFCDAKRKEVPHQSCLSEASVSRLRASDRSPPSRPTWPSIRRRSESVYARPRLTATAAPTSSQPKSARRSKSFDARTSSGAEPTRSSSRLRCFSPRSSTQTERSEPLLKGAPRALRGRADLQDLGRVGVRLLPAKDRMALAARGQLLRLRLPAGLEGAAALRRAGTALSRAAADARRRHPGRQAPRQALAHDGSRS